MNAETILLLYLAAISLEAAVLTLYDKWASRHAPRHRVRESALMIAGALGGALVEWLLMLLIRHKTKHTKFMVGLPCLAAAWAVLVGLVTGWLMMTA